ncbi:spore germination protein [Alicyclobacillus fastidiosus]|uniref:Spore germination protein n=1 Tax=Alicyclobacillus fastidiosus TaxID=392011 RepID=A0ABY6ZF11_9BACL|nr:GerAB/ArcD/ProY family transporter [Alicyclobacillus fastidiosus]WAH41432.1 spore germination protein [Alicyclobacillus fastidiosus]
MKQILSWFQVIALTSTCYLALMLWFFPRIAVEHAGLDALWAVLGVTVIGVLTGWVLGLTTERFPNLTGAEIGKLVWGKWIGTVVEVLYIPIYIYFSALCIYFFVVVLNSFLPNTPLLVLMVTMCLVAARGAWLGVESLGRVASIVFPITFLGTIVIFLSLLFQAHRFWIPHTVTSWSNTIEGIYYLYPLYFGFTIARMLSPYYEHKKLRSIWYPIISAAAGGVAIIIVALAVILNLGWEGTRDISFSLPFAIQLVRLTNSPIERVGIVIIILTTAFTVLFVSNVTWALSSLGARIFNMPEDKHKWFICPIIILTIVVAASFRSEQQAFQFLDKYLVPLGWVEVFVIPLLQWITAVLRGLRTEPVPNQKKKT